MSVSKAQKEAAAEVSVRALIETPSVSVRDVHCRGACRHQGDEECAAAAHLVFAYRGVFARHLGREQAVAEANQVVLFNPDEGYRISHPVDGGDACLSVSVAEPLLRELTPDPLLRRGGRTAFERQRLRIDTPAQALIARLRRAADGPLAQEEQTIALVARALGAAAPGGSPGRQRLADRVKLLLAGDLARRWTLAEIGAEAGASPVYLTQVFRAVEGVPLYRYQLNLRLARALDALPRCDDLTALALDLGFSSHSHFTAAFRQAYGAPPSAFRA
jgi:AraC-like DNA-binding protein